MQSIAENLVVFEKRVCTNCKVEKLDGMFIKCLCGPSTLTDEARLWRGPGVFFKTCITCRDSNKKYRDKVKAAKALKIIDDDDGDDTVLSVSSSTSPSDYFVNSPPPPRSGPPSA